MERYHKVHTSLATMLKDRGFDPNGEDGMSLPEFSLKFPRYESLTDLVYSMSNGGQILVTYVTPRKTQQLGVEDVAMVVATLETMGLNRAIIVSPSAPSSGTVKEIANIQARHKIQVFQEDELYAPIGRHIWQPRFSLATEEDKQDLEIKLGLQQNDWKYNLPKLRVSFPICKYYAFEVNDLVRILRKDGSRSLAYVVDV